MIVQELFILGVLITLNSAFAMAELALVSCRKSRLEQMRLAGDKRAAQVLKLLESPTLFLSTVQIGMTVLSILSGVYGGMHFAGRFAPHLASLPVSAETRETIALCIVVTVITYLSLVFGEILPKRFAIAHPEEIAKILTPALNFVTRVLGPGVKLLEWSTEKILLLSPISTDPEQQVTEEEIKFVIEQGAESGALENEEAAIMTKVFTLRDRTVRSLMTPRGEIVWFDASLSTGELWERAIASGHAFVPICEADLDHVLGIVAISEFARKFVANKEMKIQEILIDPLRVPVTISVFDLLEKFRESNLHYAIVFDEYGGTKGIVTLHDITEALLGELQSPLEGGPAIRKRADGSYLIDAGADMFEVCSILEISEGELRRGAYHSLGGFILNLLGRIPAEGETFLHQGWEFEILDMDRYRIDKVLVRHGHSAEDEPDHGLPG